MFYAPFLAYKSRDNGGLAWRFVVVHGIAFGVASFTEVPFIRNNWTSVFLVLGVVFFLLLILYYKLSMFVDIVKDGFLFERCSIVSRSLYNMRDYPLY